MKSILKYQEYFKFVAGVILKNPKPYIRSIHFREEINIEVYPFSIAAVAGIDNAVYQRRVGQLFASDD